jgi:hypothetical protein
LRQLLGRKRKQVKLLAALQSEYSLFWREPEETVMPTTGELLCPEVCQANAEDGIYAKQYG